MLQNTTCFQRHGMGQPCDFEEVLPPPSLSARQTKNVDTAVLKEMAVESESTADSAHIKNSKGNRVTKTPVFTGVPRDDLPCAILLFWKCPNHRQTAGEEPFAGEHSSQLPQQQRMGLDLDVVCDEAWPLLRRNLAGNGNGTFMIGVICVQQREDCARIPENTPPDVHLSRIACLSRAPRNWPPLRPAPFSRNMGWLSVKGGISAIAVPRAAFRPADNRTRRRPPRLTLSSSPRCSRRHSVEREIPNAWIASSIVNRFVDTPLMVSQESHCLIRLIL
jgi:hypothetical protein